MNHVLASAVASPGSISATRIIPVFVFIICVALTALQASSILGGRQAALADAQKDTANLTGSLVLHAEATFRSADALLLSFVERLENEAVSGPNLQRLLNLFAREASLNPQFAAFMIGDRDGATILASGRDSSSAALSERDYFIPHRDRDTRGFVVGSPARARTGGWIIPTSRRFNRADGSFGGIAVIALDAGYFQALFDGLNLGRNGAVLLASTNGRLLVRRPFVESNVGRDMSQGRIFEQLKIAQSGSGDFVAATDGIRRINSYEQSLAYPLVIAVAQEVDELLAPWKEGAIKQAMIAFFVLAFIVLLGAIVWHITRALAAGSKRLEITNNRFEVALANMTQGLCLFDARKNLVISNSRFREIYNLPAELVAPGTPLQKIVEYQHQQGVGDTRSVAENVEQIPDLRDQTVSTGDGRVISISRVPVNGGGWVATHEDITERRLQEKVIADKADELAIINGRFDAALNNMTQGLSMFDSDKRLVVWNARYEEMFAFRPGYLKPGIHVNALAADLVGRGVLKSERAAPVENKIAEMDELKLDASWIEELSDGRFILISRQPMAAGGWLATSEDITERRRAEAEIVRLARHDPLTGLANRAEFGARLEEATRRMKRYGSAITVMMLDLDKFKIVNDTLGHPAGDKLLVEVARRLKSSLRDTDLLARLDGDEFAIIQEGRETQNEGAIALALRLIQSVAAPFDLDGNEANVGTSIGIVLAPEHGTDPDDLMKKADLALYAVKAAGRNDFRIFHPDMLEILHGQQTAESELRRALENDEFELHYQGVWEARTGELRGVEALVRWKHPARGLLGPDQFIPLAESTGLIVPLGNWVLQRACADAATWPADIKVAVNISAVQFKQGNLFDVILCTLVESGLPPDRLELEITETVVIADQRQHLAIVRQLKNLGISIALDDFGTGYSSVSQLIAFPFDKVKIDKSFMQGALSRRDHRAMVESTLVLAKGLGMTVTAEGIESEQQLAYATAAGVQLLQGYLLGRPVSASLFRADNTAARMEMGPEQAAEAG